MSDPLQRHPRPLRVGVALCVLAATVLPSLAGCTRGIPVTLPDGASSPACAALEPLWPRTVSGRETRAVDPISPAARAWGDPAIIAICGYAAPPPSTLECVSVDGVDWVVQPRSNGVQFTTYGREPALDVLVPSAYAPEPLVLPAFGAAARSLPATGRACQ